MTKSENAERLFVYGTLAPGERNHHMLENVPGSWEPASLRGTLIHEGWGADHGCPAIVPDDDGQLVAGHLFSSAQLVDYWTVLDEFEGSEYQREQVSVQREDGSMIDANVYALCKNERDAPAPGL